jgi:hypothetical protein
MEAKNDETDIIFVLQHGNNGFPGDWAFIKEAIEKEFAYKKPLIVSTLVLIINTTML